MFLVSKLLVNCHVSLLHGFDWTIWQEIELYTFCVYYRLYFVFIVLLWNYKVYCIILALYISVLLFSFSMYLYVAETTIRTLWLKSIPSNNFSTTCSYLLTLFSTINTARDTVNNISQHSVLFYRKKGHYWQKCNTFKQ